MENYPVHFCPNCGRHKSLTTRKPDVVVCFHCDYRDLNPAKALFGRAEWDECQRPELMLLCVRGLGFPVSPRKKRLIACALTRTAFFDSCTDPFFRAALTGAEEWADTGHAPPEAAALRTHLGTIHEAWAAFAGVCLRDPVDSQWWKPEHEDESGAEPVRELFCNPFRAFAWNPEWFSSTVRDLAQHIYDARDFAALPILADALQDTGCDNEHILSHCRANTPHLRGCWVLDAILGKS